MRVVKRETVKSKAEAALLADLTAAGYPPKVGHAFHEYVGWEFDFAYPTVKLAIEVNGRGRHQSLAGYEADCQKLNAAIEQGWRVLQFPAVRVEIHKRRARIVEQIARCLHGVCEPVDSACVLVGE